MVEETVGDYVNYLRKIDFSKEVKLVNNFFYFGTSTNRIFNLDWTHLCKY